MLRALDLAIRGWGRVHPNPMVGAVLLQSDSVVGEGHHAEFGGPHAEIAALEAAGSAKGATCVVSLEPCAHHGKTPPCVDALIDAGVSRVVYAVRDPTPSAGGGAARLRDAGIEVVEGIERERATALNAAFFCAARRPARPFVALKIATSLDGFLADHSGRSQWISSPPAREYVQWLRAGFDAIAVGRKTAEADDPQLTVRGPVTPRIPPTRVVISAAGVVRDDLRVFRTAGEVRTIVMMIAAGGGGSGRREGEPASTGNSEPRPPQSAALPSLPAGVGILHGPDLSTGLETLRVHGIRSVLVEGGGALATSLLEADLVDRLYWIKAPIWLGRGVAAFKERTPADLEAAHRWTVSEQRAIGPDTLLVIDREPCLPES